MKSNKAKVALFIAALILCWWWIQSKNPSSAQTNDEQPLIERAEQEEATPTPPDQSSTLSVQPHSTPQLSQQKTLSLEEVEHLRSFAKGSLSAAYTAQRSYMSEFGRFTTDLEGTGWQPIEPIMRFKMGFLEEFIPVTENGHVENPRYMNTDNFVNREAGIGSNDQPYFFKYSPEAEYINLDHFGRYCRQGCTASERDFEMILVLPLGEDKHDVWLINSNKQIELVQDGLK